LKRREEEGEKLMEERETPQEYWRKYGEKLMEERETPQEYWRKYGTSQECWQVGVFCKVLESTILKEEEKKCLKGLGAPDGSKEKML
jgi:hypothetical protein